jgi:hypothetical protein
MTETYAVSGLRELTPDELSLVEQYHPQWLQTLRGQARLLPSGQVGSLSLQFHNTLREQPDLALDLPEARLVKEPLPLSVELRSLPNGRLLIRQLSAPRAEAWRRFRQSLTAPIRRLLTSFREAS